MRIKIPAISGALAASTLLAAPATADEPTAAPGTLLPAPAPTATAPTLTAPTPTAPTPTAPTPTVEFLNSCNPAVAALPRGGGKPGRTARRRRRRRGARRSTCGTRPSGWRVRLTHDPAQGRRERGLAAPARRGAWTDHDESGRSPTSGRVRLEDKQAGEWVAVRRPKRKVVDFRFVNGGFIDGINFTAGCAGCVGADRVAGQTVDASRERDRPHAPAGLRRRRADPGDHCDDPGAGPLRS